MENKDEMSANEQEQFVPAEEKVNKPKKVDFKKRPETQKQSMMDKVRKDLGQVVVWMQQLESNSNALEKGINNIQRVNDARIGALSAAIRVLFDTQFKDAPTVKEADINESNFHDYAKIIGYYYMFKDETVIRIIPIEEGWKVVSKEPSKEMFKHEDKEYPTEDVTFNYEGILESANSPLSLVLNCVVGVNPMLKLKEHLFSLKEKKTDIIM